MFTEHDDFYTASGYTFLQLGRTIVEPPGACKSNHQVLSELADRLGGDHPTFRKSALNLIDESLKATGYTGIDIFDEVNWIDRTLDFESMHYLKGFGHPDRRFHLYPNWCGHTNFREDMPKLPDHYPAIDDPCEERPFRLVTAPARWFLNTSLTECTHSVGKLGEPHAMIHPRDAQKLGLEAGDFVKSGNQRGSVGLRLKIFDGINPAW